MARVGSIARAESAFAAALFREAPAFLRLLLGECLGSDPRLALNPFARVHLETRVPSGRVLYDVASETGLTDVVLSGINKTGQISAVGNLMRRQRVLLLTPIRATDRATKK